MIDIEEKEPKVFDQEPKEITIEDAKSYYNAKYLNDRDVYDTDSLATTEAGIVQFVGSLKKLPSQLRMAGGQAMYATGEQMVQNEETREGIRAKLLPQGSMIFNGNLGVKVGEQLKESGKYNIITANRNLETLNREIENDMPNLSEEDRKSWGLMIAQQGLDYGTMLGLSLIHPVLGMGYMGTKIYGQETEEGAEAYKRKFGTIEGFEELSGDELRLNIANTAVQEVIEKAFGAPAQIKSFKTMKDFGKAFFTGFGEEFITENLQNASDAVFDHIGKRLQEDETIWTQITDNFKGTLVAGMFGGTAGTAFAIHNRSQGIQNFEKLLDGSDVAPEDRNALATDLYNAGVNNLQGIITKELELNSQLRAKHGEVYDRIKSQIDKQYRYAGAYEGKTEAEIAQYLESTAKREADHVLAEAQLRNTLIDNVMNSSDIVFKNGRLYLVNKPKDAKPRQYNPEKMSLLTYLKYKGGLKDVGGDLKAMDAGKQFVGLINNKSGRSLDDAAMDAWESGYFPQFPERPTVNDLLNAISDSLGGKRIYRESYRQRVAEKEAKAEIANAEGELDSYLSNYLPQEQIDAMSQDEKQQFYSEKQAETKTEDDFVQEDFDALNEDEQERYSMMREYGATHEEAMDTIQNARGVEGDDIFALYQESMDIAEENARLDDIYPAYKGETITINGQEKTVYNSEGKRIAKSKEALENFYKWFGDSKVVDEQGRPLVVYHGTDKAGFNIFDKGKQGSNTGNVDEGFFFGDRNIARTYTKNYADVREEDTELDEYDEQPEFSGMYNVYLKIEEPEIWDFQGASWDGFAYGKYAIYDENEYMWLDEDNKYKLFDSYEDAQNYLEEKGYSYRDGDSIEDRGKEADYTIKKDPQIFESTRELASEAKGNGLDGVIFENINDIGKYGYGGEEGNVYVAFESNQIKSTSNRGTYSESENIFYHFEGRNSQTAALDKLNQAEQLDAQGVDNEQIRQQTGWFKGVDGKWRFEISDRDAVLDTQKLKDMHGTAYLGEILEHKKLFDAYPNLKDIRVHAVTMTGNKGVLAQFIPAHWDNLADKNVDALIRINENILSNKDKAKTVLLHEIQHAIQTIEGFATGGSSSGIPPKEAIKTHNKKKSEETDRLYAELAREVLGKKADDFLQAREEYSLFFERQSDVQKEIENAKLDLFYENVQTKKKTLQRKIDKLQGQSDRIDKEFDEFVEKYNSQYRQAENEILEKMRAEMEKNPQKYLSLDPNIDAYEFYYRLYGEIEARNVEARANLTDRGIMQKTPESTQGIKNASAIVVFDDGTMLSYETDRGSMIKAMDEEMEMKTSVDAEIANATIERNNNDDPSNIEPTQSNAKGVISRVLEEFVYQYVNQKKRLESLGKDVKISIRNFYGIVGTIKANLTAGFYEDDGNGNIVKTGKSFKNILDDFDNTVMDVEPSKNQRLSDFSDYLIAQRYLEDLSDREDVMVTEEQKEKSIADLLKLQQKYGDKFVWFEEFSNELYDYQKKILHKLVDSGNMTEEQFEEMTSQNKHYVPFNRVVDDDGNFIPPKGKFTKAKSPVKKIRGSEREIKNVFQNIVTNISKVISVSERNKIAKEIADALVEVGEAEKVPPIIQKKGTAEIKVDGEVYQKDVWGTSPFEPKGTMTVYENGKRTFYKVHNADVLKELEDVDHHVLDYVVKLIKLPSTLLRRGATEWNPDFVFRNPLRDIQIAFAQSTLYKARDAYKIPGQWMKAMFDVIKGTDLYNERIAAGGGFETFMGQDEKGVNKNFLKVYKDIFGENSRILQKMNPFGWVSKAGEIAEQTTRQMIFNEAKRQGYSSKEASFISRDTTLDFAVAGKTGKMYNQVIPFLNAGIRASATMFAKIAENPKLFLTKALITQTIPSILMTGYYLYGADDDDRKEFLELPQWRRHIFWNFKIGDTWWAFPKAFALSEMFATPVELAMIGNYEGEDKPEAKNMFMDTLSGIYGSLSPIGDVGSIMPVALKLAVEQAANYNFFTGRRIYPEYMDDYVPYMRTSKSTPEIYNVIGKKLNISPARLEHISRSLLGGTSRYITDAGDALVAEFRAWNGEKIPSKPFSWSNVPVIRGFVTHTPAGYNSQSVQNFYDALKEGKQIHASYNKLKGEEKKDFAKKHQTELRNYNRLKSFEKSMKSLRGVSDAIMANKNLGSFEKADKIDAVEKRMTDLARKANNMLKKTKR